MSESLNNTNYPKVAAVISTRDRASDLVKAVKSILACDYPNFELIVVDQSDGNQTAEAIKEHLNNPRFKYVSTDTRGLSIGRNLGISMTDAEFIAITDDDCEVKASWLRDIVEEFQTDKRIGLLFGNVIAADYDLSAGFIPCYTRDEPFIARSIKDKNKVWGIGACIGLRREAWEAIGGFDPMLGAGSILRSAEDDDVNIRMLRAGFYVYETPKVSVLHYGFRSWQQGRDLTYRDWYGLGAVFAKFIKLRYWAVLPVFAYAMGKFGFVPIIESTVKRFRPQGFMRPIAFVIGFRAGLFVPVDKRTANFITPQS